MDRNATYKVVLANHDRTLGELLNALGVTYSGVHAIVAVNARPENMTNPGFHDRKTGYGGRKDIASVPLGHGFTALVSCRDSYYGGYPDPGYTVWDDASERSAGAVGSRRVKPGLTLEQLEALDRRPFGGVRIDPYSSLDKVEIVPVAPGATWGYPREGHEYRNRFKMVIPAGGDEGPQQYAKYFWAWWPAHRLECAKAWAAKTGVTSMVDLDWWAALPKTYVSGERRAQVGVHTETPNAGEPYHVLKYEYGPDYKTPAEAIPAAIISSDIGGISRAGDKNQAFVDEWIMRTIQAEAHAEMERHKRLFAA